MVQATSSVDLRKDTGKVGKHRATSDSPTYPYLPGEGKMS